MNSLLSKKIGPSKQSHIENVPGQTSQSKTDNLFLEFVINNYRIFIGLICLIVMAGSFFGFFWPQYRKTLDEVNNNYQEAQQQLVEKQQYQANLIALNEFYKKIDQATHDKVIDMLPAKLDKENLLAEIEAICLANSLMIKSSDVTAIPEADDTAGNDSASGAKPTANNEGTSDGRLNTATIKLELQGKSYQSFKGLLKTIENNLHLMDIKKMDYFPGKNQIVLNIQIYYLSN